MTRTGKIARLPKAVRDTLNRRLHDGEPGKRLAAWLNLLPEVRAVLAAEFAGRPITENNLSEWKTGGYREWELQQEALERARNLTEQADELRATAGAMADQLAVVLAVRYAAALAEWDGDPEAGNGKKLRVLRALCEDVVELRRGDHSAARLKLEQERRAEERERTEEEVLTHFHEWVKRTAIREAILADRKSPEELERKIREIFGMAPKVEPAPNPSLTSPAPETIPATELVEGREPETQAVEGNPPGEHQAERGERVEADEPGATPPADPVPAGPVGKVQLIRPNPTKSGQSTRRQRRVRPGSLEGL